MLFSKLLRVFGPPGTTFGNVVCFSGFSRTWNNFTICPSSSFLSDIRYHNDQQHEILQTYFRRQDQKNSNLSFPLSTSLTSVSYGTYSYRTMISRQLHTATALSTSFLGISSSRKPAVIYCEYKGNNTETGIQGSFKFKRLFSSNRKDDESSNKNSKIGEKDNSSAAGAKAKMEEGVCKPPISSISIKDGFQTRESVSDFLAHLTDDQKDLLYHSLNIDVLRDKYEGHLGSSKSESHQYLSRFGRPAAAISGKEDPTGTLCEVSPKWLHARLGSSEEVPRDDQLILDEKSPPPSAGAVWAVGIKNALPFIGFGFLDNLIMILAGDYIDITIGTTLGISTMAAAALGNTISDVAGIGSAWYIEELASKVGIKDPELTPSQVASWPIRWACNGGRAIGVVIGCLLGMVPLLFLPSSAEADKEQAEHRARRIKLSEDNAKEKDSSGKDKSN